MNTAQNNINTKKDLEPVQKLKIVNKYIDNQGGILIALDFIKDVAIYKNDRNEFAIHNINFNDRNCYFTNGNYFPSDSDKSAYSRYYSRCNAV